MRPFAPLIEPLETRYAPAAVITIADFAASEGTNADPTHFSYKITLVGTRDVPGPVTVEYTTVAGTATAGADFIAKTETITFGPTETEKTITIDVTADDIDEANEQFTLAFSNPSGATLNKTSAT